MKIINVNKILYSPSVKFEYIDVLGERYAQRICSPNLYVVDADPFEIEDDDKNITFTFERIEYILRDVVVNKIDYKIYLECRSWKEEIIHK